MDVDTTISQNTAKEAFEEAGLKVLPRRLIALQEHNLHNGRRWPSASSRSSCFASACPASFEANIETVRSGFFRAEELPPLATSKTTEAQVRMCLAAAADANWQPLFD